MIGVFFPMGTHEFWTGVEIRTDDKQTDPDERKYANRFCNLITQSSIGCVDQRKLDTDDDDLSPGYCPFQ